MGTVAFMSIAKLSVNLRVGLYHADMVVSAKNLTQKHRGKRSSIFQILKSILICATGNFRHLLYIYAKTGPHSGAADTLQSFETL